MWKNYLENLHSSKNTGKDLTMTQMFDISEKLIAEQSDEIYGVNTTNCGDSAWKHLSLIGDEEVVSVSRSMFYVFFRFCVMPWKDESEPTINVVWEDKLTWFKNSSQYRTLDAVDGEPMGFEWHIFTGFTTLQLCYKVQEFMSKMSIRPEDFTGRIIFMSMFNDISWRSQDNEQGCESNANLVSLYARRFPAGRWSFFGPGSEKKWYSTYDSRPQGEWDRVAELMMIKFGESGHPVLRATSPLSRGTLKSKGGGKLSTHFCADEGTIETGFRTIISVNQLSIYGAVSDVCDEHKSCPVRSGRPVLAGQSDPLFVATCVTKTLTPSTNDPAQEDLLQKYQERVDKLSQQNRVTKIVLMQDSWQRLKSDSTSWQKDTEEFSQFTDSVACREYTLPRDEKSSDPKGWIRGNTKIGPALEVRTSYLQGKYGVEIRIESVNEDNSHSWVRISHGLNKLVANLNNKENDNNEQETSEMQFNNFASKSNVLAFCEPIKG